MDSLKERKVNKTPRGFEYHCPKYEYNSKEAQIWNWYINFETNQIYIKGLGKLVDCEFRNNYTEVGFNDWQGEFSWRRTTKEIITDVNNYIENMLLR